MSRSTDLDRLVLGPEHNGIRMTAEEFDAVADWDPLYRYELIHEVLLVNPIPSPQERDPNEELGHLLRRYRDEHAQGACLDATLAEEHVRVPDGRRRADRVIWAGLGRRPDPQTDSPTIVVEFVSAGRRSRRRDYVEKRDEYLALGVREYWVIDRFERTMTVFRRSEAGVDEAIVRDGDVYRPVPLPGFELPLAVILAAADRWASA